MEPILEFLIKDYPWITVALGFIGTLVTSATAIIALTPTKKDDKFLKDAKKRYKWLETALNFVERFSVVNRKK